MLHRPLPGEPLRIAPLQNGIGDRLSGLLPWFMDRERIERRFRFLADF